DWTPARPCLLQPLEGGPTSQDVLRLVREPGDTIGVVLPRVDEPQVAQPEILERPHDVGDVDELLGLVEDDGDHYMSPEANKCGMRNSECRMAKRGSIVESGRRARRTRGTFRIPHFAFRIGL